MPVIKEIWKEHKGKKHKFDLGVLAGNVETDEEHQFLTSQEKGGIVSKDTPISNAVQFTAATARANIISGETMPKIMGKICRVIGDLLSAGAGFRSVTDAVNQGAETDVVSRKALKGIDDKLGGVSFVQEGKDIYAVYRNGADTVRKKLGSSIFYSANTVVNILYLESSKNLQAQIDGHEAYGNMSVFDLSIFPGYKDFVFGENIMAAACIVGQAQDSVNADVMLMPHKKLQHNIDAPIADGVTIRDFADNGAYAPQYDRGEEEDYIKANSTTGKDTITVQYLGDTYWLRNRALYCPQNGKLYCICCSTSTIIAVSLYCV